MIDERSAKNIKTLHPEVAILAAKLIETAVAQGICVKVISGLHTYEEQNALYAQARSKPGLIVRQKAAIAYITSGAPSMSASFPRTGRNITGSTRIIGGPIRPIPIHPAKANPLPPPPTPPPGVTYDSWQGNMNAWIDANPPYPDTRTATSTHRQKKRNQYPICRGYSGGNISSRSTV